MKTVKLQIEGMSCGHCVAAVREVLSNIEGVESAEVDIGTARVQSTVTIDTGALKSAIDDEGYSLSAIDGVKVD